MKRVMYSRTSSFSGFIDIPCTCWEPVVSRKFAFLQNMQQWSKTLRNVRKSCIYWKKANYVMRVALKMETMCFSDYFLFWGVRFQTCMIFLSILNFLRRINIFGSWQYFDFEFKPFTFENITAACFDLNIIRFVFVVFFVFFK